MIKVLYVISVLALFVLATMVKKKEDKIDFLTTFFVEIVVFTCYNIISCLVLKAINLNTTLVRLTIINVIVIIPIVYKIIKDKQLQKYYVKTKDVFAIIIIAVVGLTIAYINFGLPINVSFLCTDASNHYTMTTNFYTSGNINTGSMCGAYINYGIFFKVFFDSAEMVNGIYLFVMLEVFKFICSGILFYLAVKQFAKGKVSYIVGIVLSLIYMIAYPLNGMLCGFVYLELAVDTIATMLIVMANYEKIGNKLKNLLLFMLTFGLMFNYYLLVPPVYVAVFLFELKNWKNNKKETMLNILEIFLLPCIIGFLYFLVWPRIGTGTPGPSFSPASVMTLEGYIYVSYFSVFLFFIPFNIYHLVENIRKKKIDFLDVILIINTLYIIFALVLKENGILSRYYAMKPYFTQWLIMAAITAISFFDILDRKIEKTYKVSIIIVLIVYVLLVLCALFITPPCSIKVFEDSKEGINTMFDIYLINKSAITHRTFEIIYTNEELQLLRNVIGNLPQDTKVLYLGDDINRMWAIAMFLQKDTHSPQEQYKKIKEGLNSQEEMYVVCLRNVFIKRIFKEFADRIDLELNKVAEKGRLVIYSNK